MPAGWSAFFGAARLRLGTGRKSGGLVWGLAAASLLMVVGVWGLAQGDVHAEELEGSDVVINTSVDGYTIDMTIADSVAEMNVVTSVDGRISADYVNPTVTTNSPFGYLMLIKSGRSELLLDTGSSTDQFDGVGTTTDFVSGTGTVQAPVKLTERTWGFAVKKSEADGVLNGFADDYEVLDGEEAAKNNNVWAKVPTTDVLIKRKKGTVTNEVTNVWFGARAALYQTPGNYSATVTITVIAGDEVIDAEMLIEPGPTMVPVKYDTNDGKWKKADVTNENNDWYNYDGKRWANAVVIGDGGDDVIGSWRPYYNSAAVGMVVPEEHILAYFVYIPRFRYQVQTLNFNNRPTTPQLFNIQFENLQWPSYTKAPVQKVTKVGDWLTHPAFTLDPDGYGYPRSDGTDLSNNGNEVELDGFWMGKFEVTGDATYPTIKPAVASQNMSVSGIWNIGVVMDSYYGNYLSAGYKTYPIDNYKWGAAAYLAMSKYGQGTTTTMVAASAGLNVSGTLSNVSQSTTGDQTGVYDMNRGRWEWALGNFGPDGVGSNGAGFATDVFPATAPGMEFMNFFPSTDAALRNCSFARCAGMATFEVDGWSGDSNVTLANGQWTVRGGGVCPRASSSAGGLVSASAWAGAGAGVLCGSSNQWAPGGRVVQSKFNT